MFSINRSSIDTEATKPNAKTEPVTNNQTVFDAVKLAFVNLVDTISSFKTYNAAQWVLNNERWRNNLSVQNKSTYRRGEIVFLDLGAQNYAHEPSYNHACIVLASRLTSILIVPCSTKKYGTGHSEIIDATPADGFLKNTGIQSESFRWVNKNRVVSRTGKTVSSRILDALDEVLISFAPSNKMELKKRDTQIIELTQENEELRKQIARLKLEINEYQKKAV